MMNGSSAVFISNVDDYLSPSQACVNPIYNNSKEDSANTKNDEKPAEPPAQTAAVVVPRQRRRRPRVTPNEDDGDSGEPASSTFEIPKPSKMDPIKASMADCLACSGCVTTAETVLLEQNHSLAALKTAMSQSVGDKILVATISPAVWADMLRHLQIPPSQTELWQRKLASCLQQILQVKYVLDGNLPLQWTLLESAEEFCRAYQQKYSTSFGQNSTTTPDQSNFASIQQQLEEKETPSIALSSQQAQYMLPDGSTQIIDKPVYPATPTLPLLTSACPALVCLVEKSTHSAARHLSHTKSPMSMAGAWWCQQLQLHQHANGDSNNSKRIFHLAFMPCHDKKLEASRKDFARNGDQDVDLALTTQEWFQMMVEYCQNTMQGQELESMQQDSWTKEESLEKVRMFLESLSPAPFISGPGSPLNQAANANGQVTLLSANAMASTNSIATADTDMELVDQNMSNLDGHSNTVNVEMDMDIETMDNPGTTATTSSPDQNSSFFTLGSGGLAEFVFRYAAWRLFDTHLSDVTWKPVAATTSINATKKVVSARVQRRAAAKNRDYYQVTLFRHTTSTGSVEYTCDERAGGVPVLRFAIAYGLQTVQRVLEPFQAKNTGNSVSGSTSVSDSYAFDFVEAMACPSGCLNGGGQLRVADRETPSQTRERVALTRELFPAPPPSSKTASAILISQKELEAAVPQQERQTGFHVVPPLQHSMGAAAGVAVKDTQW